MEEESIIINLMLIIISIKIKLDLTLTNALDTDVLESCYYRLHLSAIFWNLVLIYEECEQINMVLLIDSFDVHFNVRTLSF